MADQPSGAIYGPTAGISRNMEADLPGEIKAPGFEGAGVEPFAAGGGDKNGSAAVHFLGQSGTNGSKNQVPRTAMRWNYCGVV